MLRENEPTQSRPEDGGDTMAGREVDAGREFEGYDAELAEFEEQDEDEDDGVREMAARVHHVPRMSSFLVLGAIVGVVLVTILTFAFPPNEVFSRIQVFAFLLAFTVPVTLALGGIAGYIAGRVSAKRSVDARLIRADELENRS
ncbi:hypothetical protein C5E07_01175 [Pseudoclavibacter sp. RFBJ3]|uniref:hypothetical protein n=1 Tax=unclassified Pseudoclavibacter TaxID=2615177 RepID=UPI000CE8221B|nr:MULTISPECIES: hypothetical protein [unclassified Pseudoclavibacter]MBF4550535.1 hypothetical protein [Pseudoclavibacter sp. VKM Ac-2888]PPF35367.1 hypothetical protein C5E05_13430 [Pseudoclavibacter sp. AY1H1]PPF86582.1 hypothetical protein C5C12_02385 [Pseudoclavibacter sp. RFBJ5]PPF95315.1 hypothetical protein C5E07_01175 [Pseudoclavibacter sp. RFBJ3]PPF97749.1 hypothetical protein C5C19_11855 [Pseudoclavibacter sp. RFBH5]